MAAQALVILVAQLAAVVAVVDQAVARHVIAGQTSGQHAVDQRPGKGTAILTQPLFADRHLATALRCEGRRAAAEVDRAGRGVLAVQGALGPTQHLDALDIEQIDEGHALASQVDPVEEHPDAAVDAIVGGTRAESANAVAGIARAGHRHQQAGHALLQLLGTVDPGIVQLLASEHVHGNRHALRGLLAAPRADRHIVEHQGRFGTGSRLVVDWIFFGMRPAQTGQGHKAERVAIAHYPGLNLPGHGKPLRANRQPPDAWIRAPSVRWSRAVRRHRTA